MKVKVCGITNFKDARVAVELGADALGFIFAPSPRQIKPKLAHEIISKLGPYTTFTGVFVNQSHEYVLNVARECRLDALQLHGEESIQYCRQLAPYKIIKTFRMGELFSVKLFKGYDVDAYLFETASAVRGGSGKTWAWESLPVKKVNRPFIVSGGLNAQNVTNAIEILRPYGVDVASGVEKSAGIKNHKLMERFIKNAKTSKP